MAMWTGLGDNTELFWAVLSHEPDTAADEEDPALAVEESTPLPQDETVAQGIEATLPETTMVEGK
jgi:hypothetical protein